MDALILRIIAVRSQMTTQFLSNTELVGIRNVTSVVCQEEDKFGWEKGYGYQITTQETSSEPEAVYFVLDTHNQNAFAHWVFENFVYLPLYFQVKQLHPSCKIVLYEPKDYKYLFLEHAGVSREDIVDRTAVDFQYQTLANEPLQSPPCKPNCVYFHPYVSLNQQFLQEFHCQQVLAYHQYIQQLPLDKTLPILYLPRGEKENFAGLDRRYVIQPHCKQWVEAMRGMIFETDGNTSLANQIQLVRSAKILLCDYGSNLWVNGFFSQGAHLVFLNIGWKQEQRFPYYNFLYNLIASHNKSMTNLMAYSVDSSVSPNLVYHSFEQVKQILRQKST